MNVRASFKNVASDGQQNMETVQAQLALGLDETLHEAPQSVKLFAEEHARLRGLWQASPRSAFNEFKRGQRVWTRDLSAHSVEQYTSMFGHVLAWLEAKGQRLESATPALIDSFLNDKSGRDGRAAAQSTRRRYLRLLFHTFEHLREVQLRSDNPTAPLLDLRQHRAFERPAPAILGLAQSHRFVRWSLMEMESEQGWHLIRDHAIRMLMLGSGITVQELQRLHPEDLTGTSRMPPDNLSDDVWPAPGATRINGHDPAVEASFGVDDIGDEQTQEDLAVQVAAHGFVPARRAPVACFAQAALTTWRRTLAQLEPASHFLFPARIASAYTDRPDGTRPLAADEVFRLVQRAFVGIGHSGARQGPQTLRNAFIARQIYREVPADRILAWTGLKTTASLERIKPLLPSRQSEQP